MSNTYVWNINYMDTKPSEDGLTDVVMSCQWSLTGTNDLDPPTTAGNYGYTTFGPPSTEDFTAYADLTQEQVLSWVWSMSPEQGGVDQAQAQAGIDAQIQASLNPPTVVLPNPWSA